MNKSFASTLLFLCFHVEFLFAQSFTKITDSNNPIVQDQFESGGGAWIDFNNDGLLDLFVANGNLTNQPNSLYLNLGNGNFKKITSGAIINDGGSSIGSTWADFDNDGFLDVFVTNRNNFGNFLYRGNGDTTFTKVTMSPLVSDIANSNSASWVDMNNDGNVDLFVTNFQGNNFSFINLRNGLFVKDTNTTIIKDAMNFSILGLWSDFNNDRFPDLFIGNAGIQNDALYRNIGDNNNNFQLIPLSDGKATVGASWGDFNNDGFVDLFAANGVNQTNILYKNSSSPDYALLQVTGSAVTLDPGSSVGSCWADFDNDGDLDLFVANDGQNNALYMNSGPPNYEFTKVTTGEIVNDGGNSFGAVAGDYDNDGFLDLFVANRLNQKNFLYRNNGSANKWLKVKCVGVISNKSAIGAKVRVLAQIKGQSIWQLREVSGMTGYNSQSLLLHFGLGDASMIDSLVVEWPSGMTDVYTGISPNQTLTLTEKTGPTSAAERDPKTIPTPFWLGQNYPNPFNPNTTIQFELSRSTAVTLRLFDVQGKEVRLLHEGMLASGVHSVLLNARALPSGVYFYELFGEGVRIVKKMTVSK